MKSAFEGPGERILVTGASGFLGSHLSRFLCMTRNEVHGISRNPHGNRKELHWWQGDLSDFTQARRLLGTIKPEVIFHLTTHGWGAPGLEHVLPTLHNDLVATVNLLTIATELKIRRIILTASLEEPTAEEIEPVPSSPYAAAKWASGAYARMFHRLYHTPVVLVRVFMTYGPGQPAQKLIPYVISSLLKGQAPQLSSGQRLVDWVYVDDVIDGFLTAAAVNGIEGRTVDLGTGTLVSVREVVQRLVQLVKTEVHPSFGAIPPRPAEPVRIANAKEAYDRLGWKATTPLDRGLESTVKWYRSQLEATL